MIGIIDMSRMFQLCLFNQPIEDWDVSKVTNMNSMFVGHLLYTSTFNQPPAKWNVSKVTDMGYMFCRCIVFNQPLDNWNVR